MDSVSGVSIFSKVVAIHWSTIEGLKGGSAVWMNASTGSSGWGCRPVDNYSSPHLVLVASWGLEISRRRRVPERGGVPKLYY